MAKVIVLCLLLAGCGSFQLASSISTPLGKSEEARRLDILDCKDRAHVAASSGDKQVGAFLLGFTIVGAPVAYALDRREQRDVFRECMEGQGYRVVEAHD